MNVRNAGAARKLSSIDSTIRDLRNPSLIPGSQVTSNSRIPTGSDFNFFITAAQSIATFIATVTFEAGESENIARFQLASNDGGGWVAEPAQIYSVGRPLMLEFHPVGATTNTASWRCMVVRQSATTNATVQNKFYIFSGRAVTGISVSGLTIT